MTSQRAIFLKRDVHTKSEAGIGSRGRAFPRLNTYYFSEKDLADATTDRLELGPSESLWTLRKL